MSRTAFRGSGIVEYALPATLFGAVSIALLVGSNQGGLVASVGDLIGRTVGGSSSAASTNVQNGGAVQVAAFGTQAIGMELPETAGNAGKAPPGFVPPEDGGGPSNNFGSLHGPAETGGSTNVVTRGPLGGNGPGKGDPYLGPPQPIGGDLCGPKGCPPGIRPPVGVGEGGGSLSIPNGGGHVGVNSTLEDPSVALLNTLGHNGSTETAGYGTSTMHGSSLGPAPDSAGTLNVTTQQSSSPGSSPLNVQNMNVNNQPTLQQQGF